jgi:ATP-dependent DNA ligase
MFHEQRAPQDQLSQFKPCRAKKKVGSVEDLTSLLVGRTFSEQKIDGERYEIQTGRPTIDRRFLHGITSRRESEVTKRFVEKTDRVPHISNAERLPGRSMLDCEFVSSGDAILVDLPVKFWDKLLEPNHPHMRWLREKFKGQLPVYPHVSNTVSIMGSLGSEAVRKQTERGMIWAYCFDIPQYLNQDARRSRQVDRRILLAKVLSLIDPENGIVLMPAWHQLSLQEVTELFYIVTDPIPESIGGNGIDGGEGLILKDYQEPYDGPSAWWKLKRDYPGDVVLTGECKIGEFGKTGQMEGMASSLEIGVYCQGMLVPIGWISAILDGHFNLVPHEMAHETFAGRVIEVRHNGLQTDLFAPTGHTLRHPRFRRWRDDKNARDCTWLTLESEVKGVKNA